MRTVLTGGHLFDVQNGRFDADKILIVQGDRIEAIDSQGQLPSHGPGQKVIDVGGRYVLPGLIDSHFHLISRSSADVDDDFVASTTIDGVQVAQQATEMGLTTVRDAGCKHGGIHGLKRAINAGQIRGPRAFVAGVNPTGTGSARQWRSTFHDGPWELRRNIREQWRAGADWIKLILSEATNESSWRTVVQFLSRDEISACVDEAHDKGIRVGCHCEGLVAAARAVELGLDSIDHGTALDEATAVRMAQRGVHYVPTLWVLSIEQEWGTIRPDQVEAYEARQRKHQLAFRCALDAGVVIAAGTDSVGRFPRRDSFVLELEALMAAGMSSAQALRAATLHGAAVLGMTADLGSLERGKLADLIVVDRNPLDSVRALINPSLVMKAGEVLVDRLGG